MKRAVPAGSSNSARLTIAAVLVGLAGCAAGPTSGSKQQSETITAAASDTNPVSTDTGNVQRDMSPTAATSSDDTAAASEPAPSVNPVVIAHRGASAYRPESTLAAFRLAIEQGADFVEPDVVMTKDGHAIVRHDNQLEFTTDVADRSEFGSKRTTKLIGGDERTGWFSEDFTLEEIRTLRAIERNPELRPESARHDGEEGVPTLREVLELVVETNERDSLDVGVYPELKFPSHFESVGLDSGQAVLGDLAEFGFDSQEDKALIQSLEVNVLRGLDDQTDLQLVQLFASGGAPPVAAGENPGPTYAEMATPDGLSEIANYAEGVAVEKNHYVIPLDASGVLDATALTAFVADAHAASLFVHVYTFRAENEFLPANFRSGDEPNASGDVVGEIDVFLRAGIDGFFVDQVDLGRAAVRAG